MSEYKGRRGSTFECVDRDQESIPGSGAHTSGALLHHVEASCNGMPCPPYMMPKKNSLVLFAQNKLNTIISTQYMSVLNVI